MPQFDPSTYSSQVFWLVVSFLLLAFSCRFCLFPRIHRRIEEREFHLREEQEKIKVIHAEIGILEQLRQEELKKASEKAEILVHDAIETLEQDQQQQLKLINDEIRQTIQSMRESFDKQRGNLDESLYELVATCVQTSVKKILSSATEEDVLPAEAKKDHVI